MREKYGLLEYQTNANYVLYSLDRGSLGEGMCVWGVGVGWGGGELQTYSSLSFGSSKEGTFC